MIYIAMLIFPLISIAVGIITLVAVVQFVVSIQLEFRSSNR